MDITFQLTTDETMDNTFRLTTDETIILFVIIVVSIGILIAITLCISSYPFERLVNIVFKHPVLDLEKYYFYYQKATTYRLLFINHLIFSKILKVLSTMSTFIVVYCAMGDSEFTLLFSLLTAICEVISLITPFELYSKIYVQAARELEYVLNNDKNLQEPKLTKKLNAAYKKAEKIIEDNFE